MLAVADSKAIAAVARIRRMSGGVTDNNINFSAAADIVDVDIDGTNLGQHVLVLGSVLNTVL